MLNPSQQPSFEQFREMSRDARLVPLYKTLIADLDTPLGLFKKVAAQHRHSFLFESMEGGEKWGRFSFIGFDPIVTFSSRKDQITIARENNREWSTKETSGNPMDVLRSLVREFEVVDNPELPRFCGGAVGFLGYDMVRHMEELPDDRDPLNMPDSSFMVPRMVLVHDGFHQTVTVVCWVRVDERNDLERLYQEGIANIDQAIEKIQAPLAMDEKPDQGTEAGKHNFISNMEPAEFHDMVEKARDYIRSGDIIQVVLSQRFHTKTALSSLHLYRALRHINPSPYLFYLRMDDLVQIGSSPEILVRKEGENIELRPIAGTRKRGDSEAEDLALEKELLADPKERAEHLMLVDLGRNDVGRIAKPGSVEVGDLLVIERYSHVMHIVSGVHGLIRDDMDQFDVIEACFPAGTVSGAPKIRAMEIIDELEPQKRGPYAGAVGYFGFSGNMDFCITIRTFVMQNDDLWLQAGAGIVYDSDPEKEFEETVNKSMGLRRAVELAETGF